MRNQRANQQTTHMSRTWWYANSAGKLAAPYQKHQLSVPRLPIPTLEESCTRYLRAAQLLQSSADHAKTKQVVADFCKPGGEGELSCKTSLKLLFLRRGVVGLHNRTRSSRSTEEFDDRKSTVDRGVVRDSTTQHGR